MSERIELTRGEPDPSVALNYSGSDVVAALQTVIFDSFAFGAIKVWTDAPDLLYFFYKLLEEHHPAGGQEALWRVYAARFSVADRPIALEHPTQDDVDAWVSDTLRQS